MLLVDLPYNLAEWTVSFVLSGSNHTARGCVVWHSLVPTDKTINTQWTPAKILQKTRKEECDTLQIYGITQYIFLYVV